MMETKQFPWRLTVSLIKEEKERVKERKVEMAKDGGTTCGNFLVVAVVVKAVESSEEREIKEKESPKERKVESPNTKARTRVAKAKVPREIPASFVGAMITGVVSVPGR